MLPQQVISSRPVPSKMPRPWASQPGEVRTAILLLLSDELLHGYQIMQARATALVKPGTRARERSIPRLPSSRTRAC